MTDGAFIERLLEWSNSHKGHDLCDVCLDEELGPWEAAAGPGSQVSMGKLAFSHCCQHVCLNHESN